MHIKYIFDLYGGSYAQPLNWHDAGGKVLVGKMYCVKQVELHMIHVDVNWSTVTENDYDYTVTVIWVLIYEVYKYMHIDLLT